MNGMIASVTQKRQSNYQRNHMILVTLASVTIIMDLWVLHFQNHQSNSQKINKTKDFVQKIIMESHQP